jgi:hypothetical protein
MLREKDAARILGVSVYWMQRARWAGGGPQYIKLGTTPKAAVRYLAEDLEDYIKSHRTTSTSAGVPLPQKR